MKEKRSARIAMRRQRILSQKRPAAGGEAREQASFFCIAVKIVRKKVERKANEYKKQKME